MPVCHDQLVTGDWAKQWAADAAAFMEAETARILRQVDEETARAALTDHEIEDDDEPPETRGGHVVTRRDYVPKADEARYLARDPDGRPLLKLVDAGDRLAIWTSLNGGALINPKGPGLRSLGLVATYARGSAHHAAAFRSADLRKGQLVELHREPDNPHDRNAVALHAPGTRKPFGYVQGGRAATIARRLDGGEQLAAVSMHGPGRGRDDDTAFLLVGSRDDLRHMLR